jgi:hypothetical protein
MMRKRRGLRVRLAGRDKSATVPCVAGPVVTRYDGCLKGIEVVDPGSKTWAKETKE